MEKNLLPSTMEYMSFCKVLQRYTWSQLGIKITALQFSPSPIGTDQHGQPFYLIDHTSIVTLTLRFTKFHITGGPGTS